MESVTTSRFRACFDKLPTHIQESARKSYQIWKENHNHPGLQFKLVDSDEQIYSVRVSLGYRALGVKDDDTIVWFWIGSHAEYDAML